MMVEYLKLFWLATVNYGQWLWRQITFQEGLWGNYFYYLIAISLVFLTLEWFRPWRKNQPKFRRDFWLDAFYMFFNFFVFSLIIFAGLSEIGVNLFNNFLGLFGITNVVAIEVSSWPVWVQLLTLFVVKDFVEWWVHRLLHHVPALWEFHKVHHSVKEMGFAAHLRFHWMESVLYKSIAYIPLAMIGFGIDDFFIVHIFAIAVGHWNHANFRVNIGPLKYIFNNPDMHMWHHAYNLPEGHRHGMNYGLSLSLWDYIFGTAYQPHSGRDIEIGFHGDEEFPDKFVKQISHGFTKSSKKKHLKTKMHSVEK